MNKIFLFLFSSMVSLLRWIISSPFIIIFLICHFLFLIGITVANIIDKNENPFLFIIFTPIMIINSFLIGIISWINAISLIILKLLLDEKSYNLFEKLNNEKYT